MARQFVVVTQDGSGLGWVKKLQEEKAKVVLVAEPAPDDEARKEFRQLGVGWATRVPLEVARRTLKGAQTYWLFDTNALSSVSEALRKDGRKVLGAGALSAKMEGDRAWAVAQAKAAGFAIPETREFQTPADGVAYLDSVRDQAYVCKPVAAVGAAAHLTLVPIREDPAAANREVAAWLRHVPAGEVGAFVLQRREHGVEVAVEAWYDEGRPFLATANLENKRRSTGNLGELVGCAGDFVWVVPLDSKLVRATVGKFARWLAQVKYTGFADCNVILGDRQVWFLEAGFRMAYNAGPNLILSVALEPWSELLARWLDHQTGTPAEWTAAFRGGFGASITLRRDHPHPGVPLAVSARGWPAYFPYDLAKRGDDWVLTGYSEDVGVMTHHDYTMEDAAQECVLRLTAEEMVSFPDMDCRTDLGRTDYVGAPIKRYAALKSLGYL